AKSSKFKSWCVRPDPSVERIGAVVYSLDLFFFSSRRRHTRFSRDWSSDVCSSDLHFAKSAYEADLQGGSRSEVAFGRSWMTQVRSEERRVGKGCRIRWRADHTQESERSVNRGMRDHIG